MTNNTRLKVLLFGAGRMAESIFPALDRDRLDILAIVEDPPREKTKSSIFAGIPVVDVNRARVMPFDYVLLACRTDEELEQRLMEKLEVPRAALVSFDFARLFLFSGRSLPETVEQHIKKYPGLHEVVDVDTLLRDDRLDRIRRMMNGRVSRMLRQKGYIPAKTGDILGKLPPGLPFWGDFVRYGTLSLLAHEVASRGVEGSIAELGVYKGHLTRLMQKLFPDRFLYLFDTFEGFVPEQKKHDQYTYGCTVKNNFSDSNIEDILQSLDCADRCIVKKGIFPASSCDVHDVFAFVSIDVDLYQPTFDGLQFFYPRLASGGYILIHDYGNDRWKGCGAAVREFCAREGISWTPVCDHRISAVLAKP